MAEQGGSSAAGGAPRGPSSRSRGSAAPSWSCAPRRLCSRPPTGPPLPPPRGPGRSGRAGGRRRGAKCQQGAGSGERRERGVKRRAGAKRKGEAGERRAGGWVGVPRRRAAPAHFLRLFCGPLARPAVPCPRLPLPLLKSNPLPEQDDGAGEGPERKKQGSWGIAAASAPRGAWSSTPPPCGLPCPAGLLLLAALGPLPLPPSPPPPTPGRSPRPRNWAQTPGPNRRLPPCRPRASRPSRLTHAHVEPERGVAAVLLRRCGAPEVGEEETPVVPRHAALARRSQRHGRRLLPGAEAAMRRPGREGWHLCHRLAQPRRPTGEGAKAERRP